MVHRESERKNSGKAAVEILLAQLLSGPLRRRRQIETLFFRSDVIRRKRASHFATFLTFHRSDNPISLTYARHGLCNPSDVTT